MQTLNRMLINRTFGQKNRLVNPTLVLSKRTHMQMIPNTLPHLREIAIVRTIIIVRVVR